MATLQVESGRRAVPGAGRGDPALAQIDPPQPTTAQLARFASDIRAYLRGQTVSSDTGPPQIPWIGDTETGRPRTRSPRPAREPSRPRPRPPTASSLRSALIPTASFVVSPSPGVRARGKDKPPSMVPALISTWPATTSDRLTTLPATASLTLLIPSRCRRLC